MLSRRNRLRVADFTKVYKYGIRGCGAFVCVTFLPHHSSKRFQCACTVGKKRVPRAVDRNRIRRQLYGVIERLGYISDPMFAGLWIIHMVSPRQSTSFAQLVYDVDRTMRNVHKKANRQHHN